MPVTVFECEKILGVFVDNDLSFKTNSYFRYMVKKS